MNAILGVYGKKTSCINLMFKSIQHRNVNCDEPTILNDFDLALGFNIIKSTFSNHEQFLLCHGEIYNSDFLLNKFNLKYNKDNSNKVLLDLYNYYLMNNDFLSSIKKVIHNLDGDYSFVLWDDGKLVLYRDSIGTKPLYYGFNHDSFVFASEMKSLWHIGIDDVKTLIPGHILIINTNNYVEDLGFESLIDLFLVDSICDINNIYYNTHYTYNDLKKYLIKDLINSTKKRINENNDVAIIFSGGVDSTLLTKIVQNENKNIKLYTVGTKNSNDLKFAKKAINELNLDFKEIIINKNIIKKNLEQVIKAIEEFNIMKIGVAMPLHIASKTAYHDGFQLAISGQGADELFGGYTKYLKNYEKLGSKTQDILYDDIKNSFHVNLQRDEAITAYNNIELKTPFMDKNLIKTAMKIPIKYKIKSNNDKMRKHILRDIALDIGVPEFIALRPKKAAQYGSGVHKILIKKILPSFNELEFMENIKKKH